MSNFDERMMQRLTNAEREIERLKVKESSGAWLDWTPTLSVSGGTAPTYTTFINRYCRVGKLVTVYLLWDNGTGGTAGAGTNELRFTLPLTAAKNNVFTGSGLIYADEGLNTGVLIYVTSTTQAVFSETTSWSHIVGNHQSNAIRYISATFTYEAA